MSKYDTFGFQKNQSELSLLFKWMNEKLNQLAEKQTEDAKEKTILNFIQRLRIKLNLSPS